MKAKIFYFSSTGNSLYTAREIAGELGDEIMPIPKAAGCRNSMGVETIGIVFPVYAWGLPRIVGEFAANLILAPGQYVFAAATCGGTPGDVLGRLKKILKKNGHDLNSGFLLREDFRAGDGRPSIINLWNLGGIKPVSLKVRLSEITGIIKNRENHKPETSSLPARVLGNLFHDVAVKHYKNADLNFSAGEKCDLCGVCLRVCPRENIVLENGRQSWKHNCESCYGCFYWCPRQAIRINNNPGIKAGYHNPEISLEDMLLR
jgi:ferredoxin